MNGCKVKGSLDDSQFVCKHHPLLKSDESMLGGIRFRGIGRPDEVHTNRRCRGINVSRAVMLQPKTLVNGIKVTVRWMWNEEFD